MRDQLKELTKQYDKSENDLKALQSVGQVGSKKIRIKFLVIVIVFWPVKTYGVLHCFKIRSSEKF